MIFLSLLLHDHRQRSKATHGTLHVTTTENIQISSSQIQAVNINKGLEIGDSVTDSLIYNSHSRHDSGASFSTNVSAVVNNTTDQIMTSNLVSALLDTEVDDKSAHRLALMILIGIFLFISLMISIGVIVFCKKKNSVFMLQKCEQDSELEMDDINTEVETSDSEYEELDSSNCISQVKAETYPCLSKYVNEKVGDVEDDTWSKLYSRGSRKNGYQRSPSAMPLLQGTQTGSHHDKQGILLKSKRHSDSQLLPHRYSQKTTNHSPSPPDIQTGLVPESQTGFSSTQNMSLICEPRKKQTELSPTHTMTICELTEKQSAPLRNSRSIERQTGTRVQSSILNRPILRDNTFVTSFSHSTKTKDQSMTRPNTNTSTKHRSHSKNSSAKMTSKGANSATGASGSGRVTYLGDKTKTKTGKRTGLGKRTVKGGATKPSDSLALESISCLSDDDNVQLSGRLEIL